MPEMRIDPFTGRHHCGFLRDDDNDEMVKNVMQRLKWWSVKHYVIETRTARHFSSAAIANAWGTSRIVAQVEELPWHCEDRDDLN
jgi:hypothetical protein